MLKIGIVDEPVAPG